MQTLPEHPGALPSAPTSPGVPPAQAKPRRRLFITAGPTHEPIDAVRFIGNRSSGKLGVSLADAAVRNGWKVTLALGPQTVRPTEEGVNVLDFRTTADLEAILIAHQPGCDALIMAAAVADYRPAPGEVNLSGKRRRTGSGMTLHLESTPDLLAGCAQRRASGQILIGFALEPREEMLASAQRKLERKGVDAIIANPLETMDANAIEASAVVRSGIDLATIATSTPGPISKDAFAPWLLTLTAHLIDAAAATPGTETPR